MRIHSEANLSALIDSTKDLIWAVDLDGRLTTCNRAWQQYCHKTYGVTPTVGMRLEDFFPPESVALWLSLRERVRAEGSFQLEQSLANDSTVELTLNPIVVDGKTTGVSVFGKDITKRKTAEKALQEAEKEYRAIFDGAIEGIFQSSPEGKAIAMNHAALRILGYDSLDDLNASGANLRDQLWVDEEERARFQRQISEQGVVRGFECQLRRKDGTIFWSLLSARKISDADGRYLYVEGFILDNTEHKQAEMALRESEMSYRSTIEQAAVGIAHISFEGRYLRCNTRFVEIAGYPLEEFPSLTIQQMIHPDDRAENESISTRLSKGEIDHAHFEERLIRKDGSLTWVRITTWPQRDSKGRLIHMVSLAEDINARKIAEQRLAEAQNALRMSEEHYRAAFEAGIDAITISNIADEKLTDVNQAALRMFGFKREEVLGHTVEELHMWASPQDRLRLIEALREGSVCRDMKFQLRKKDGQKLWVLISGARIELAGVPSIHLVVRDISAAKATTEALRISEERYRTVFDTSPDAISISRLSDGRFIDCNQAFLDDLGYEREEVIERTAIELGIWANPVERRALVDELREKSACRSLEAQFKKKNGEVLWAEVSASEMKIDGVPYILSIARDLSQAKAAENTIRSLAFYDPLTGLPNRRLLMERLVQPEANSAQGKCLRALLRIDLDNFKTLNDTLGHQKGDLLLQEAARRISACVHEADTVCRLGSDEYVVLLEGLCKVAEETANQVKAVGERIMASISQPYLIDDHERLSTASIGVTVFGNQQNSTDDFLQQADIALHQAKAAGRNMMRFFSPALQTIVNARAAMEDDLRQAIKKEQFELYYQPQVNMDRLTGVEALIRWRHPSRGLVLPDEFIPMAEETGLILALGEWVLNTACMQIAAWKSQQQHNFGVSVNISALQFRQPEFVAQVRQAIERTGSNPRTLKLELTESVLAENIDEVIAKMKELKSHGLRFSLDDFGTGYSSLSYLKFLPLDELKIDRSFVSDMLVDATSRAIAQSVISMGHAMGLSVVAEGVETEEQRNFLADLGCHTFQGYLYSPPLPLNEFQKFLKKFAKIAPRFT
jgi:diguanylate cyclase (GGDEF)-like protein/PAS domain S-box-containing protein